VLLTLSRYLSFQIRQGIDLTLEFLIVQLQLFKLLQGIQLLLQLAQTQLQKLIGTAVNLDRLQL
jgi:hypothetical protein